MTSLTKSWIDHLSQEDSISWLQAQGVQGVFPTRVLGSDGAYLLLENKIPPDWVNRFIKAPGYTLHTSLGVVNTASLKPGGRYIKFPSEIEPNSIIEGRKYRRFSFEKHENISAKIINPFDNETLLNKRVLDLSISGLSFETKNRSRLLEISLQMDAEIYVENKCFRSVKMEIIYVRRVIEWMKDDWLQVGVKFLD